MNDTLEGKVVLVTGASSGIGQATALALSSAGASVAVGARRTDRLKSLAEDAPGEMLVLDLDVTDRQSVQDAVAATVERFGALDAVVNNAGVMLSGAILDVDTTEWTRMVETNLLGSMYVVHAALPHLLRSKGAVVQISSTSGRTASAASGVYAATKFGVTAFSEALRQEVTAQGVRGHRRRARVRLDRAGQPHHRPRHTGRGQGHGRVHAHPPARGHRRCRPVRAHPARARRRQRDPDPTDRPDPLNPDGAQSPAIRWAATWRPR